MVNYIQKNSKYYCLELRTRRFKDDMSKLADLKRRI